MTTERTLPKARYACRNCRFFENRYELYGFCRLYDCMKNELESCLSFSPREGR